MLAEKQRLQFGRIERNPTCGHFITLADIFLSVVLVVLQPQSEARAEVLNLCKNEDTIKEISWLISVCGHWAERCPVLHCAKSLMAGALRQRSHLIEQLVDVVPLPIYCILLCTVAKCYSKVVTLNGSVFSNFRFAATHNDFLQSTNQALAMHV